LNDPLNPRLVLSSLVHEPGAMDWFSRIRVHGSYFYLFDASNDILPDTMRVYYIGPNHVPDPGSSFTPDRFCLYPVFPNPFNSSTKITYTLPTQSPVTLQIYNTRGQLVDVLLNQIMPTGQHSMVWDGSRLENGVYYINMNTNDHSLIRKGVLIK